EIPPVGHLAPGLAQPAAHVDHRPDAGQPLGDQKPGQVEVVDPGGGALDVHHEALVAQPGQLGLRCGRDPDVRAVAPTEGPADGAELGAERGLAVIHGGQIYMLSGAAMPRSERPVASTMRTASARANRAARSRASDSWITRLSRSWLPSVYQRLKWAATSSR